MSFLLAIFGIVLIFGPLILSITSFVRTSGLREEMNRVREQNERLDAELVRIRRVIEGREAERGTSGTEDAADETRDVGVADDGVLDEGLGEDGSFEGGRAEGDGTEDESSNDESSDDESVGDGAEDPEAGGDDRPEYEGIRTVPDYAVLGAQSDVRQSPSLSERGERFEQALTSQWMVWLGGIALAIAGLLFAAYSIEQGWIGPRKRIILGFLFGLGLTAGGEWVRRRPFQKAIASIRTDYVPPALSAAGLSIMFTSVYAGHALYGLYPTLLAFIVLAIISLGAIAYSLLQGWFIALLGIVGSFVTPALMPSDAPSAWTLFPYLMVVLGAGLAVVYTMSWWWVGFASLALGFLWCLYWLQNAYTVFDALIVGAYILFFATGFYLLHNDREFKESAGRDLFAQMKDNATHLLSWGGIVAALILLVSFVRIDQYQTMSLATLGVFVAGCLLLGHRERVETYDGTVALAGLATFLLFASWHIERIVTSGPFMTPDITAFGEQRGPLVPPELATFSIATVIFAGLFGLGGFLRLWSGNRALISSATSACMPVLLLIVAYIRFQNFGEDFYWAMVAVILAACYLAGASIAYRFQEREPFTSAVGFYAASVFACITLGLTMTLEQAWLTVAIAVQLPALAWINERVSNKYFRYVAWTLALAVIIRLVFNVNILEYGNPPGSVFTWNMYAYGVPALAFYWAARKFTAEFDEMLIAVLEAAAMVFLVLLVSFEIRLLMTGSLSAPSYSLLERGLHIIAWLTMAYGMLRQAPQFSISPYPVYKWGAYLLIGLAVVHLAGQMIEWLLIQSGIRIGRLPIINALLAAYLAPAILFLALRRPLAELTTKRFAGGAGIMSLILTLFYVTLEVKHWFQAGPVLGYDFRSNAESYAVSVAWLAYALSLLAAGIVRVSKTLRYASLAILMLVVLKVFLVDLAQLEGLLRVASFLGLGFSLIGIGYIYQRFVFADTAGATPEQD